MVALAIVWDTNLSDRYVANVLGLNTFNFPVIFFLLPCKTLFYKYRLIYRTFGDVLKDEEGF